MKKINDKSFLALLEISAGRRTLMQFVRSILMKAGRVSRMGNNEKNFIEYLKLPIRIISVFYLISKSIKFSAFGEGGGGGG
ncbi:MAG: hypothetical protein JSV88_13455, partial [Candidatus Aminicenantes bacterium]